jgi:hypothetical protein
MNKGRTTEMIRDETSPDLQGTVRRQGLEPRTR